MYTSTAGLMLIINGNGIGFKLSTYLHWYQAFHLSNRIGSLHGQQEVSLESVMKEGKCENYPEDGRDGRGRGVCFKTRTRTRNAHS